MSLFTVGQASNLPPRRYTVRRFPGSAGAGTLRIECSHRRVRRDIMDCLKLAMVAHEARGTSINVKTKDIIRLSLELAGGLSIGQQALSQVRFDPDRGRGGGVAPASRCLHCFLVEAQRRWLTGMLRRGGLTSVFQPIVRCGTNEVFGFEALMRGEDAGRLIAPERLLAAARETGLTLQLDRHACSTAVAEAARHRVNTKLFVNVTPSAFNGEERGVPGALRALEQLQLSPHQIVFELVESEPVADWKKLRKILGRYRECGFQVALDDFGVAYSSPDTLYELRPDFVKLDRTLISGVHLNGCRAALTGKLIEAAREFGARIIAEGVESAGEYNWTCERGVDYAQGFYISKPATPPPFMNAKPQAGHFSDARAATG